MKKVRLSLKRGARPWSFVLFDSPESAYYLKNDILAELPRTEEYCTVVTLKSGETMEVEWLGSEYVYDDEVVLGTATPLTVDHEQYVKVRIGKLTPLRLKTALPKSSYLELYSGWVTGGTVPWTADEGTLYGLRIIRIKGRMRSKMDFSKLFEAKKPEDDEDPSDISREVPEVLN